MSDIHAKDLARRILGESRLDDTPSQGIEYCDIEDGEGICIGCGRNASIIIRGQCVLRIGEFAILEEFRRKTETEN